MTGRFATEDALRASIEQRLLDQARRTGRPLDRLRKEVAHHRLLARLLEAAPPGAWALKGGMALLARLDDRARATSDADANWRSSIQELEDTLDRAVALNLGDGFSFDVGPARPLTGETGDGALRFPIVSALAGREFERLSLDVNVLPLDVRAVDEIRLRDLLGFADIPAPLVPAIPIAQQLAEKLHAYVRTYGTASSRPRDLYDMLVMAERLPIPTGPELIKVCRETFSLRVTTWPPEVGEPPADWSDAWREFVRVYEISWTTLAAAGSALLGFWQPVICNEHADVWDPDRWLWTTA